MVFIDCPLNIGQEFFSFFRKDDTVSASADQIQLQLLFQGLYHLADSRLCVAQCLRGLGYAVQVQYF